MAAVLRALARVLLLAALLSLARAVDKTHASGARKANLAAAVQTQSQTQTQTQTATAAKTEAQADAEQPLTVLSGLVTPVEVVCTAPSCPKDETIITCTGPLLPPFSNDPAEFCKDKEPCDRDVLSQMKRLWEQRERIAQRDRAERVAQRECLFRQMERHRKDLTTLNVAAAKIRDKFLQLTRYKANMQARIDAIQTMLKDSTVETAEQYAKIQRERMIAMEKMHEKEKEEEEAAKSARKAAIKAKREREEREDELEKQRAELQKMEIEEEKVKVQEAKQRALAKLRREKQDSKKSSHDDKEEVDHTKSKLDPEDSVKAKEVETHGHDDDEEEEEEHKKSKKEEEEEQEEEDNNEKAIEKLLHKDEQDDEDRGPVGKLPRKIRRTQKATIVDSLGEEVVNNSTASQEAESGEASGASVAETTPDREKDDSDGDRDDESAHIKVHGADVLVTKKDIASLIKAAKKGGEEDEGDDEGADPKPAPKQETAKQKQEEQVHKQVDQQENAAKDALKEAEKAAKS